MKKKQKKKHQSWIAFILRYKGFFFPPKPFLTVYVDGEKYDCRAFQDNPLLWTIHFLNLFIHLFILKQNIEIMNRNWTHNKSRSQLQL